MSAAERHPVAERVVACGHLFLRLRRYGCGDVWCAMLLPDAADATRPDTRACATITQWPVTREFADGLDETAKIAAEELARATSDRLGEGDAT